MKHRQTIISLIFILIFLGFVIGICIWFSWISGAFTFFFFFIIISLGLREYLHEEYKESQSAVIPKLIEKADKNYKEGKLMDAAEQYAKALLKSLKVNYERIDVLIEWYVYSAKKIIYKAVFSGGEEDKKNLDKIITLQRTLKSNEFFAKPTQAGYLSKLEISKQQFSMLDVLIEKAQTNDLDFIDYDALRDKEFLKSFQKEIGVNEMEIGDLARRLGYDMEAVKRLLQKCIQEGKVEGYLTLDGKKFISKTSLRNKLKEKLSEKFDFTLNKHVGIDL